MTSSSDGPPPVQAALLAEHQRLLEEAVEVMNSAIPKAKPYGDQIFLMLASRVLQYGGALQVLCEAGHSGEAGPTARAMLSAGIELTYLGEDREGHSMAYVAEDHRVRLGRITEIEQEAQRAATERTKFFVPQQEIDAIRAELKRITAIEDQRLADWREGHNITATKGGQQDSKSWHGFAGEKELFRAMGWLRLYIGYYRLLSDETHVNANSLAGEVPALTGGANIGARFEDPIHVVKVSGEMVLQTVAQVNAAFGLGQEERIKTMNGRIGAALTTYNQQR